MRMFLTSNQSLLSERAVDSTDFFTRSNSQKQPLFNRLSRTIDRRVTLCIAIPFLIAAAVTQTGTARASMISVSEHLDINAGKFQPTLDFFGGSPPFTNGYNVQIANGDTFDFKVMFLPGQSLTVTNLSSAWLFSFASPETAVNGTGAISFLDSSGTPFITSNVKTDTEGVAHFGQYFYASDFAALPSTLTFSGVEYVGKVNYYVDPTITTRNYYYPVLEIGLQSPSAPVPEPSTFVLCVAGLGLALFFYRKQRSPTSNGSRHRITDNVKSNKKHSKPCFDSFTQTDSQGHSIISYFSKTVRLGNTTLRVLVGVLGLFSMPLKPALAGLITYEFSGHVIVAKSSGQVTPINMTVGQSFTGILSFNDGTTGSFNDPNRADYNNQIVDIEINTATRSLSSSDVLSTYPGNGYTNDIMVLHDWTSDGASPPVNTAIFVVQSTKYTPTTSAYQWIEFHAQDNSTSPIGVTSLSLQQIDQHLTSVPSLYVDWTNNSYDRMAGNSAVFEQSVFGIVDYMSLTASPSAVPEPSTFALILISGIGLAAKMFLRHRDEK